MVRKTYFNTVHFSHIMITRLLTCFLILSFSALTAYGIQPSQVNLKDRYDPNRHISISHKVMDSGDTLDIWMEVLMHRQGETLDAYTVIIEKLDDYGNSLTFSDTLDISSVSYAQDSSAYLLRWRMSKSEAPGLLFFLFDHKSLETNYYHDILLDDEYVVMSPYAVSDGDGRPLFRSWQRAGQTAGLTGTGTSGLQAIRYDFDFPPADPPMKTEQDEVSATMKIDSSFTMDTSGSLSLSTEGLYYFRNQNDQTTGASLLVTDGYFPRSRTLEDVIGPLIYISTSMERTALAESLDKKQALDNFLMDVTRSPERGKWLIKNYFRQVDQANQLFTTYKEGWKTDQGMVFILYGLPDAVYRTAKGEEWVYDKTEEMSKIRFTFARVKNPYTNRHFVLLRSKSYERPWFTNVDLWRKARKDL